MITIDALNAKITTLQVLAAKAPSPDLPFNANLPYKRVWGPYQRRNTPTDRRMIVVVELEDGTKRTMSAPKYKYECYTGQRLRPEDTIDHKDMNHTNDDFSNLQVLDRAFHSSQDTRRVNLVDCVCAECEKPFKRSPRHLRDKAKAGKTGPFCSKSCAARHARYVQYGKKRKAPKQKGQMSTYYRMKTRQLAQAMAAKWAPEMSKLGMNTRFNGGVEPSFLDEIDVEILPEKDAPSPLDSSSFDELPEEEAIEIVKAPPTPAYRW